MLIITEICSIIQSVHVVVSFEKKIFLYISASKKKANGENDSSEQPESGQNISESDQPSTKDNVGINSDGSSISVSENTATESGSVTNDTAEGDTDSIPASGDGGNIETVEESSIGDKGDGCQGSNSTSGSSDVKSEGTQGSGEPAAKRARLDNDDDVDEIPVVIHGHREDPFIFCSRDDPIWPAIRWATLIDHK